MPMVRDYSTTGGHLAGDEVVEGARKTVTKKWQGYPPENLNVLGKPLPPLPEVSIPRFTGKAQYASRVWFPDLLYVKFLTSPHPHARLKDIDTSAAEKMPGVHAHPHVQECAEVAASQRGQGPGLAGTAAARAESAR